MKGKNSMQVDSTTSPKLSTPPTILNPATHVRQARIAMRYAARCFRDAAALTSDAPRSVLLLRLGQNAKATLPALTQIERDLEQVGQRPR